MLKGFEDLQKHLSTPLILSKQINGEDFFLYLATSEKVISSTLVQNDNGAQHYVALAKD